LTVAASPGTFIVREKAMTMDATTVHPFAGWDVPALIEARGRQRGAHSALIWAPFEGPVQVWSYAGFAEAVARIAGGLSARGIGTGDRVLLHLENCPETVLARFACAWLGATAVLSNAHLAAPELARIIAMLRPRAAITQPDLVERVAQPGNRLEWIALTETSTGEAPNGAPTPAADRFGRLYGNPLPRRTPDPTAPAMILFTTGSTAVPKAVLWTHANLLWAGKVGALQQGLRPDDIYQVHLPLFHVVGFTWSLVPALWAGASVLLQPRFSASRFWPAALAHRATVASHAGTDGFLRRQPVPDHAFRQWLFAWHDPDRNDYFRVSGSTGWGMTEMVIPAIVGDASMQQRVSAVGRPYPGYAVRIESEDGSSVRPGETGHLLIGAVRGLSIFQEYVDNPQAMVEAFDARGFFRTGDRVTLHEDGWIQFKDRVKDMIKVGGESVSASEVEAAITAAGGVAEVAVVARPDAAYGEVAIAFVVLEGASDLDEEIGRATIARIVQHCGQSLAKFKQPRDIIITPSLPKIGNNKINRPALRALATKSASSLELRAPSGR
jgi:crotonobetaine/carnitine-CoA ligase